MGSQGGGLTCKSMLCLSRLQKGIDSKRLQEGERLYGSLLQQAKPNRVKPNWVNIHSDSTDDVASLQPIRRLHFS